LAPKAVLSTASTVPLTLSPNAAAIALIDKKFGLLYAHPFGVKKHFLRRKAWRRRRHNGHWRYRSRPDAWAMRRGSQSFGTRFLFDPLRRRRLMSVLEDFDLLAPLRTLATKSRMAAM
jgi:hypothetical protein